MKYQVISSKIQGGYENGELEFETNNKQDALHYLHGFEKIKEPKDYRRGTHYEAYVIEQGSDGELIDQRWIMNGYNPRTPCLSVKDAAELLELSRNRIYQLIKEGKIQLFNGRPTYHSVVNYRTSRRKAGRPEGTFKTWD